MSRDIPRFESPDPKYPSIEFFKNHVSLDTAGIVFPEGAFQVLADEVIAKSQSPEYTLVVQNLKDSLTHNSLQTHQPICISSELARMFVAQAFPEPYFADREASSAAILHLPSSTYASTRYPAPDEIDIQHSFPPDDMMSEGA